MAFWRKQQISFFLTSNCNLNCTYCYMPKMKIKEEEDKVIDLDFARQGLYDFFQSNTSRTIRFFSSGEPTLAFNEMRKIKQMAYEMVGDELKVELETNGFFNREIAEWIESNVDILWISCDGPSEMQDTQRPLNPFGKSSTVVYKNIQRYAQNTRMQFGVRSTVSKENMNKQIELIDFFGDLGVKYVCASPTYFSKPNGKIKTPSLLEFAMNFIPAFNHAISRGMFYQTLFMVNFDEEVDIYCQACTPCPRLTTDGYVSCCDWASFGPKYLPGKLQDCLYGYYDKENKKIIYDNDKILRIQMRNTDYLANSSCTNCKVLKHCAGGCIGKVMSETNDFYKPTEGWCEAVRYLYDNLVIPNGKIPVLHP